MDLAFRGRINSTMIKVEVQNSNCAPSFLSSQVYIRLKKGPLSTLNPKTIGVATSKYQNRLLHNLGWLYKWFWLTWIVHVCHVRSSNKPLHVDGTGKVCVTTVSSHFTRAIFHHLSISFPVWWCGKQMASTVRHQSSLDITTVGFEEKYLGPPVHQGQV